MLLPERLEAPGRDVTQIQGSGSETTNGACAAEELAEERHEISRLLVHVVRKTRDEQRIDQRGRLGDRERLAVEPRASAAHGRVQLRAARVVHGTDGRV